MYQIPQPGGAYPPPGGIPPPGAFANGGFNPYGKFGNNATAAGDDESEYEYVTDDDGDYIEDEDGTILSIDEAQNRGLVSPAGEGERGIGKKLLIGGAVLGGLWILNKQLKKKKKVKKQKPANNYYNQAPPQNIYGQPQQSYGRPGGW
ncbi:hypothetical protein LY90DRAFT_708034 [Neocallimastix californiae]|jgi:hypothetical protein|uniref:Uncharacterized protein n=1 Tax=Neocallimastix californiae TaxID=1754190 RepID=A0A1Y2ADP9_9FUNG|nr:hypothetical protein LY90DRAFT_708034 [Neocallimastix californiae]|eukprot:ORY20115.1 hypothetical protein LY90DRAFT_708034 [Neocallimastix californiae]